MLAHNLGMQVIVEGVETPEQLRIVKALGADVVQGFLLGRPTSNPVDVLRRHARRTNDRMQKSAIAV
jgi:EAL domain-containing protein (putative c-di-GMP-specific phosphodiesterase class I)